MHVTKLRRILSRLALAVRFCGAVFFCGATSPDLMDSDMASGHDLRRTFLRQEGSLLSLKLVLFSRSVFFNHLVLYAPLLSCLGTGISGALPRQSALSYSAPSASLWTVTRQVDSAALVP